MQVPKTSELIKKIKQKKKKVSLTHFLDTGIRTDIGLDELLKLF